MADEETAETFGRPKPSPTDPSFVVVGLSTVYAVLEYETAGCELIGFLACREL